MNCEAKSSRVFIAAFNTDNLKTILLEKWHHFNQSIINLANSDLTVMVSCYRYDFYYIKDL